PHYAPEIPLYLVKNKTKVASLVHSEQKQGKRVGLILSTLAEDSIQAEKVVFLGRNKQEMASKLYKLLRSFRKEEVDLVICEAPPFSNDNAAILDRLERAASTIIV